MTQEQIARAIYDALRPSGDFPAIEYSERDAYDAAAAVVALAEKRVTELEAEMVERLESSRIRRQAAEQRVADLEGREEFNRDPLDPGSYAHTILVLEGRIAELGGEK